MTRRANDDGSVFKRGARRPSGPGAKGRGRPWVAAYHVEAPDGTRVRKFTYFELRREAKDALEKARAAVADGLPVPDARLTFGALMDQWLTAQRTAVAPSTWISYSSICETWLRSRLGSERLRGLDAASIQRVVSAVSTVRSPRRARFVREVMRAICAFAIEQGYLGRNPVLLVKLPSDRARVDALGADETATRRTFTTDEVSVLLAGTRADRLWSLFVLAATTGARQGELFALGWGDVDAPGRSLTIRRSLGVDIDGRPAMQPPKTRGSRRTIRLPMVAVEALRVQADRQAQERRDAGERWQDFGLVFASEVGSALNSQNVMRSYRASLARLGLPPLRFHDLRHYCATEALAAGLPAHEVARYLGHASPGGTLAVYGHITPRGAGRAAAVVDRALGSGPVEIRP